MQRLTNILLWGVSALLVLALSGGLSLPVAHAYGLIPPQAPLAVLGSGFTYQGLLNDAGSPVTNTCDFQFGLWDALSGGTQVGATLTASAVSVTSGLFTTKLDFGEGYFLGSARWLEIAVRCPSGSGTYATISARQQLTPEPSALYGVVAGARAQPVFTGTVLDNTADVGAGTAATIGTDGLGLIAYYDTTNGDLKLAHCSNAACSEATLGTLDTAGGAYPSIVIGADNLGLIAYQSSSLTLKVAHCSDVACSGATVSTVDSGSLVGLYTSVTIGTDGLGLISYYDASNTALKVAHCSNTNCTSATLTQLDGSTTTAGLYTSIAIASDGYGLISYVDNTNVDLMTAHCTDTNCTAATVTAHDTSATATSFSALTIGVDNLGVIVYRANGTVKAAHCSDAACTSATYSVLDSNTAVGSYAAIALGADGLVVASYHDATNGDLKVAHCVDVACSSATVVASDSNGNLGTYTSITIGMDGMPLISYYHLGNTAFKVLRCSDRFCVPYARR